MQTYYDAFNRAVSQNRNGAYTQIVYAPSGQKFAFMNGSTVQRYFVPLAAGMQAVYNGSALQYYRHADWLGNSRFAATASGSMYYDAAYAPFGENYAETGTPPGTTDRSFTGQTQDTATGLYDFLFRQQSSSQGRWLVPDPAGMTAVDITNPQTWNRYAYVGNNPLSAVDPQGLRPCDPLWEPCSGGGGGGGPALGSVGYFYSGEFSGTWTQGQMNGWETQQFFGKLWYSLPAQQNPKAQSPLWEAQYQAQVAQAFAEADANSPDKPSCGDRLAKGVLQNTGMSISNLRDAGSTGGHENYTFDVADPSGFQNILNQNPPWPLPFGLDTGYRYGVIESTHIENAAAGGSRGHTDLFSGHWLFPLHLIFDVRIGHIPGVNLDFGCTR